MQVFLYFQKSDRDPRTLRGIVRFLFNSDIPAFKLRIPDFIQIAILWCLDALHLVFASHAVYTYLVSNFANVAFTTVSLWSLVVSGKLVTLFGSAEISTVLLTRRKFLYRYVACS